MLVDYTARFGANGSIIHGKYDSDKKSFGEYDRWFNSEAYDATYYPGFYNRSKFDIDTFAMTEAALLSHPDYRLCIDHNRCEFKCQTYYGVLEVKKTPEDLPYCNYDQLILDVSKFSAVGVEIAEYSQLRYQSNNVFRIMYRDGYIITAHGLFKLSDSYINRLTAYRSDIRLYKYIRDNDEYFGYLFLDTAYGLLRLDNGILKIKELSYGNPI